MPVIIAKIQVANDDDILYMKGMIYEAIEQLSYPSDLLKLKIKGSELPEEEIKALEKLPGKL